MSWRSTDLLRGHLDGLLLAVLGDAPGHGYQLARRVATRSGGHLDVPEGSLYPALHRLEQAGMVSSRWAHSDGRRCRGPQANGGRPAPPRLVAAGEANLRGRADRASGPATYGAVSWHILKPRCTCAARHADASSPSAETIRPISRTMSARSAAAVVFGSTGSDCGSHSMLRSRPVVAFTQPGWRRSGIACLGGIDVRIDLLRRCHGPGSRPVGNRVFRVRADIGRVDRDRVDSGAEYPPPCRIANRHGVAVPAYCDRVPVSAAATMFAAGAALPGQGNPLVLLAGPALAIVAGAVISRAVVAHTTARWCTFPHRPLTVRGSAIDDQTAEPTSGSPRARRSRRPPYSSAITESEGAQSVDPCSWALSRAGFV